MRRRSGFNSDLYAQLNDVLLDELFLVIESSAPQVMLTTGS